MGLKDLWNKATGRNQKDAEPDLPAAKAYAEDQKVEALWRSGNHPEQIKAREANQKQEAARNEGIRADRAEAGRRAEALQKPGPAERVTSQNNLVPDAGQRAMTDKREERAKQEQEVSEGKRPPIKPYSQLHPDQDKGISR
jgi:hypothetical protein